MPGEIKHYWSGTTLMIESDSGVSGCDLKGRTGDIGPRGPQGRAGIVYDADGNILMDGYATEDYVDEAVSNVKVDLTGYATEKYVDNAILSVPQPNLDNYATKQDVEDAVNSIEIPEVNLNGYATELYVDNAVKNVQVDLTGYATEDYVEQKINAMELPDLDDFATKEYVDNTNTIALANYYTKDEVDETIANLEGTGGGGGGATNNAILTLQNKSGWLYKVLAPGAECQVKGTWSSLEDGLATGNGVLTITVNGVIKYTADVSQGTFIVDVAPYISVGTNTVKVMIADVYTNTRSIIYSVEVVAVSLASTFDAKIAYTGTINFPYVATGNLEKTVYFKLDGKQIGTQIVLTSGRQETFVIPAQAHGSHTFEVYFIGKSSGMTVESNHLYYDLICTTAGTATPIVATDFNKTTVKQFETVQIYYTVYTPDALTSDIVLKVNGKEVNNLTVDRTQQLWAYRADEKGTTTLTITCGTVVKTIKFNVEPADINVEAATNSLDLYLSSYGRSNSEGNPATWKYNDIECQFTNYNWKSDGWVADDNGLIVHRLSGDARLTIPLLAFENDARDTGKTIEIEFATRHTMDYDAVIATCMNEGIGFEMTAQKASIKSEQSAIATQYKEDEHIRLTFVIEKKAENRLMYVYLNGIMCGAVQYAENDNFAQANPVGITFGSNAATMDIYTIRVYSNNLTRHQVLDNWIADTQDINERFERYNRNKVYDAYGNIIINNLPKNLPYLILGAPKLPESKGNEVIVETTYNDPSNKTTSFYYTMAKADVQGTSSAGYTRKNYIIEYPDTYKLRPDSIPTNIFTYKADVASSEGANNVELVRLYNDICPYKTPAQLENPNVRQGIDGFPIVVFHNDGTETKFIGKYNFNNDKATPEVFGFEPGDESWEIRNNTSNRVLFKSADFEGTDWLNDFEARYPKDNVNAAKLAEFATWVVSTDTTGCDEAEKTARLEKFRNELPQYAEVQSALFYYLFTELFLMVDSRAKNAFPTFYDGNKVCWLPYDMDTAMGINNEGALTFGYELEDTDLTATGADVYNGQKSVFWNNLRDTYGEEIKAMYQKLRSDNVLSYDIVEDMFEAHQSVWPEAIWNEDAWYKYLQPLVDDNDGSYLGMLQGSKEEQRKWWLYNRFRYMDAKYIAGDAKTDFITLRGYEKSDITITPYADIYGTIQYGSYWVQERALRGSSYTLECPMDTLNDTEIYIYSASQLKDIGDLSGLKVGYADFASATRLQNLKLGSGESGYTNNNLLELYLGNNTLLQTLDARNCPSLGTGDKQQSVNLTGCTNIEHVYLDGTAVKGCALPNGGILKTLHLPATITNLTIMNQKALTDLSVPNYGNISTLRLENVGDKIDMATILRQIKAGSRVRLIGVSWNFDSVAEIEELFDILDTMKGLDENDRNMAKAQISGTIHVPSITGEQLESLKARYNTLTYTYDSIAYNVYYLNYDGEQLYTYTTNAGTTAIDPVATGKISKPTKPGITGITYVYTGWDSLPVVNGNTTITAQYRAEKAKYTVQFYNGSTLLQSVVVEHGQNAQYTGTTPEATSGNTLFAGWNPLPLNVQGNMTCKALFASETIERKLITDSWDTVMASIDNGTYATKYKRGNYIKIDLGDQGIMYSQIIGFYCDKLSDGTGYAAISWLNMTALANKQAFGTTGCYWSNSTMRTFLNSTAINYLPANVKSRIVSVVKTTGRMTSGTSNTQTTYDKLWLPSYHFELITSNTNGEGIYKDYWDDGSSDTCYTIGGLSSTVDGYWLRDNKDDSYVAYMKQYSGDNFTYATQSPTSSSYVRFGFCT